MPKILVVDDRQTNREYLASLLSASGYQVAEACDGLEALQVTRAQRPHLVLADILMPTMDGYEFVRHLRDDPAVGGTPVIFLTAHYAEDEVRNLAENCGVFHVITKPAEPEVILGAVSMALGLPPPPPSPASAPAFEPGRFASDHVRLLTDTLARKADQLEFTNARLNALIELGSRIAQEHDPRRMLSSFCNAAGEILRAKYALVAIMDDHSGAAARTPGMSAGARHILASGSDPRQVALVSAPGAAEQLVRRFLPAREALLVGGATPGGAPAVALPDEFALLGPMIVAPIATVTHTYGLLCLGGSPELAHFNGSVLRLVTSMGAVLGIAYENALRFEQIESHATRLQSEVTERKIAQERVQALNAELERRVAERTAELEVSHQRLRQSERMAAMGTLCAGLGHDMANLLLPLRMHVDAIRASRAAGELDHHVSAIRQCIVYLQGLTRGLRMLSLDPDDEAIGSVTELSEWQNEVMPMFKSVVPRGVTMAWEFGPDLPAVAIARHRLTQSVFNLVSNAADALRERGSGNVRVWAQVVESDAGDPTRGTSRFGSPATIVRIAVNDDGPGMDEHVKRRALEPFFTTKKRGLSTGLGLSLVHSIVQAVGGRLEIDSSLGQGTTVIIFLPVADEPHPAVGLADSPHRPVALVHMADSRMKALACEILQTTGFEIRHGSEPPPEGNDLQGDLLLIESREGAVDLANSFLAQHAERRGWGGCVAVVGALGEGWPRDPRKIVHLGEAPRPSELRDKLQRVVSERMMAVSPGIA